ncbi:MAG: EamA family transporter [Anaerolineae bacterium]|nr:EamA family transporter [Anaerolineae bacterium]
MNFLLLFTLGVIWGTSYLFIKVAVAEVPPFTLVAGRLGLASVAMWAVARLRGDKFPRDRRLWLTYAMTGFFNGALPFSLITWGEQYISSGLAALLQAFTPIATVILAHFLTHDDRVNSSKLLGVLLGFLGVGVLLLPELRAGLTVSLWGMVAIIASSVSYAMGAIVARRRLSGQPPLVSAAGQFTMGFVYILPLTLVLDPPLTSVPSAPVLASWVTLALLGTVAAYAIYYPLLARTNATFVTSVTYLIPITGLILGAVFLHERLTWMISLSLALVMAGVVLVRSGGNTNKRVNES